MGRNKGLEKADKNTGRNTGTNTGKRSGKAGKVVCIAVCTVILVAVIAINAAVALYADSLNKYVIGYKLGEDAVQAQQNGKELAKEIQAEGTVLVKNGSSAGNNSDGDSDGDSDGAGGDAVLPLPASVTKVNVFGWDCVDWVISGSGSGQVKYVSGVTVDFLGALTEYGIEYNTEITDMYSSFQASREYSSHGGQQGAAGSLNSFNYEFSRLYEPSVKDTAYYTDALLANARAFSDTAIVCIGRVSGESNDSPKVQYKRTERGGSIQTDTTRTYLEISTEEEELLTYVGATYANVIVLINSTNVMELGFMDTIPGLDACLVVGTTGTCGASVIPEILYGDVNPSGRLADTYAYDLTTSPSYANTGSGNDTTNFYTASSSAGMYPIGEDYANGSSTEKYTGVAYEDYQEGIYVGYKWYETADAEGFWDTQYAQELWSIQNGYEDVVQYPFGYGLSYTDFSWTLNDIVFSSGEAYAPGSGPLADIDLADPTQDGTIKVNVMVKNNGDAAGQDVVELYYSAPYAEDGVEKSAVCLGAYAKTGVIQPGKTETVSLTMSIRDMASYDCYNLSGEVGEDGGYILEAGQYALSLRTDAHTVADVSLAMLDNADSGNGNSGSGSSGSGSSGTSSYRSSTGSGSNSSGRSGSSQDNAVITLTAEDDILYETDSATGNEVSNRFTGTDVTDGVAIDGNSDGTAEITYLTRADFAGTFPEAMTSPRDMADAIKKYNIYTSDLADEWAKEHPADTPGDSSGDTSQGSTSLAGSSQSMMLGEYDRDGVYTLTDLGSAVAQNAQAAEWEQVLDRISTAEMQALVLHGYTKTEAVASVGKPETLDADGPNQIGSFLSSYDESTGYSTIILAQTWNTNLAYDMGIIMGEECAAYGINGWYGPACNIHRSPFGGRNYEYYSEDVLISGDMCAQTIQAAKAKGVYCYLKHLCLYESESGRDGMYTWLTEQALREIYIRPFEIAVKDGGATGIMTSYGRIGAVWTGGSEALITDVLRSEWGFDGCVLTDYSDHNAYMNADQMVRAGGDLWMCGWANSGTFQAGFDTTSASFTAALRASAKHILYMWSNAVWTNADYNARVVSGEIQGTITIPRTPEFNFRWYIPVVVAIDVVAVAGSALWICMKFIPRRRKNSAKN